MSNDWIKANDDIPEKQVLCCNSYGEMIVGNPFKDAKSDTGYSAEDDDCYMVNCVAWMPLPEPYEGGEE